MMSPPPLPAFSYHFLIDAWQIAASAQLADVVVGEFGQPVGEALAELVF
jgi:hypothetical protein